MALLNSGHLIWWLRQQIAAEAHPAVRAELTLTVDRAALQLHTDNDTVRVHALATLLDLAATYEARAGYLEEWRR